MSAANQATAAGVCSDSGFECQPPDGVTWCYGQLSCATTNLGVNGLVLKNSDGTVAAAENGGENQICQATFANSGLPRRVRFEASVSNVNGFADIASVTLRWNGTTHAMAYVAGSGNGANATYAYNWDFTNAQNNTAAFPLAVEMVSVNGNINSGWVDAGRSLKVWDCQVPLSGSMYDSSASGGAVCATGTGFTNLAAAGMNFKTVTLTTGGTSTTVSATGGSAYSGMVVWGRNYTITPNADLLASGTVNRWQDWGSGSPVYLACGVGNTVGVDAYAGDPALRVDMAAMADQGPWFQVAGGGIEAKNQIESMVPVTCVSPCQSAMSIGSATGGNGLLAAPVIESSSGCPLTGPNCHNGSPNDWSYSGNVIGGSYGYRYFYNNYFVKTGLGYTFPGDATMTQIVIGTGGTGVVLVNGNVNVDVNNTVDAATNKFLMIVASGKITICLT